MTVTRLSSLENLLYTHFPSAIATVSCDVIKIVIAVYCTTGWGLILYLL